MTCRAGREVRKKSSVTSDWNDADSHSKCDRWALFLLCL